MSGTRDVLMKRVLALYQNGAHQTQAVIFSLMYLISSDKRLTVVLYALLIIEGAIKAAMSCMIIAQIEGHSTILLTVHLSFLICFDSGHCVSCCRCDKLHLSLLRHPLSVFPELVRIAAFRYHPAASTSWRVRRMLPIAYGFLLLCLALYKAPSLWKQNGVHGSRLLVVLIKDQAIYVVL